MEEYFAEHPESRRLYDALVASFACVGAFEVRVTKSQVAFVRRRAFAWAWIPGRYLGGDRAPLVFSVRLDHRDDSLRWKEVVEPSPGRFMHHLELREPSDVDEEVAGWFAEAWRAAG